MGNRLKGKVAIVTGSGRGIGRGIALLMAEEGAKVVVNDLGGNPDGTGASKGPADEVVAEIKHAGGHAVPNYDDVSQFASGERIVKTALDHFGRLDILVNNAGILRDRMVFNMAEAEWDAVLAVHLKGCFNTIKFASILFRQQRSGRIINFSSTSGVYGNSGQANYGAAKDGIAGLTRVVARDLGRYGVTCNAICPSADTRLTLNPELLKARETRARMGITQGGGARTAEVVERDPENVAPIVVWLSSDAAANVNGHVFYSGGGVLGLMGDPTPVRVLQRPGRWTYEEIAALFPQTLGMDMVNPAPPQAPPQQQAAR